MTPIRRALVWLVTFGGRILVLVLGVSIAGVLFESMPSNHITIESGTKSGLFDEMALRLAKDLAPHGITVDIVNRADSKNIIEDVASTTSKVDAGFVSADIPTSYADEVSQVGTVMFAPIYLIANKQSGIHLISEMAGHKISLYPSGSAAWATCDYILRSYGVDFKKQAVDFGNGQGIINQVASGSSDAGCFIDVPSGSTMEYASKIQDDLARKELTYLSIPQSLSVQARKDYLLPIEIPEGAFQVYPKVKPASNVATNASIISFVAKSDLPQELATIIAHTLDREYRGSTIANQAGTLPSTDYASVPAFQVASDVYSNGLPWLYQALPYNLAAFLDRFVSRYGLLLTVLFLVLSILDSLGFRKPWEWVTTSRPKRMQIIVDEIEHRIGKGGHLTSRDKRRLAGIKRWVDQESEGIEKIGLRLQGIFARDSAN